MQNSGRKTIRFRGKTEKVLETFRVRGRTYFALEKLSRRGAFRVFDPHAGPHGDYRILHRLAKSKTTHQAIETLRRIGGPNGNRNFPGIVDFARQADDLFVVVAWVNGTNLRQYLDATGRSTWEQAKPFIEEGLRKGGQTTRNFAQALTYLRGKPPAAYVEGVIQSYDLPASTVNQLKQVFKIE